MAHAPMRRLMQQLAAGTEAVVGTAEVLDATDAVDRVTGLEFADETEKVLNDGPLALKNPGVTGVSIGRLRFRLGLEAGSATPRCAMYLAACGLGPTGVAGTYARDRKPPVDAASTATTLTLNWYMDGLMHQLYGAAGNAVLNFIAGQVVWIDFDFRGKHATPSDVALLAPTLADPTLLRFGDADFAIGAWAPRLSRLTLDLGNKVEFLEDENASDGSGIACAYVDDEETIAAIDPEACLVATEAVHAAWKAGTRAAATWTAKAGAVTAKFDITLAEYVNLKIGARRSLATFEMGLLDVSKDLTVLFTPAA